MFCPELQKPLKPIYDLTRKRKPFKWRKELQDSFEEIKCQLMKLSVLHMPNKTERFHLYSDTSKYATGSTLYQIQNVGFDAIVDHLMLTHMIKSKMEPAATRNKRLLELISPYSFNLYYMKGKNMVLSDCGCFSFCLY